MKLRFRHFADRLDIDAVEKALGFEVIEQERNEDRGYCILPYNAHKNGDTTGKLFINREKKVFNCWVCGGGSLVSLVMSVNDQEEDDALEWLHQFASDSETGNDEFLKRTLDAMRPEEEKEDVLPYFNPRMIEEWVSDHPWFEERGISNRIRNEFRLGVRISKRSDKDEHYEGETIVLPHFFEGRLVGWQQRWLDPDRPKWIPKYTNTRDFPRKFTLWGYDRAKERDEKPIVVESVPTALFLLSNGYSAIASFGGGITEEQIKLLRVFQQGIRIAPDNDSAGANFVGAMGDGLRRFIPLELIMPPEGEGADLGDLANTPDLIHNYLNDA